MAITKTTELYEILIRCGGGKVLGAQAQYLETVAEDGAVLAQKLGDATPLALVDAADKPTLTAAVGDALPAAVAALEAANERAATAQAALDAEIKRADGAEARAADYAGQLAAIALATPAPQEAAPAPADVP